MLVSRQSGKLITFCLIVWLIIAVPARAGGWRGIVPLHSTRADVERLLGPPTTGRSSEVYSYELERERVSFHFAKGPCGVEPDGWGVPRDTVVLITVLPKPNRLRLADLKLDESKFKKERDREVGDVFLYVNEEEGISYEVDTSHGDQVTLISYFPAARDAHLRCPSSVEALEGTTRLDSYSDIPFESEKKHLDGFAERIKRHPLAQAYIMAYAGKRARAGEAEARAERAKQYLVKEQGIDARRIVTVDGGHREEPTVELYLVPLGATPPLSTRPSSRAKRRPSQLTM